MARWLVLGWLVAALGSGASAWAEEPVRHSGNVHSFTPAEGVLVIEARGPNGVEETVWAEVRDADVVRLRRDPGRPWRWREQPTSVHWLSAGTYVTVIGREGRWGIIRARRVEVPALDSEP